MKPPPSHKSSSAGLILSPVMGVVLGVALVMVLVIVLAVVLLKCRSKKTYATASVRLRPDMTGKGE